MVVMIKYMLYWTTLREVEGQHMVEVGEKRSGYYHHYYHHSPISTH